MITHRSLQTRRAGQTAPTVCGLYVPPAWISCSATCGACNVLGAAMDLNIARLVEMMERCARVIPSRRNSCARSESRFLWPQPDKNGAYSDVDAELIRMPGRGAKAEIRVLQVGPRDWVSGHSVSTGISAEGSGSAWSPLSKKTKTHAAAIEREAQFIANWADQRLKMSGNRALDEQLRRIQRWAQGFLAREVA